jgi:hypothetical protein
MASKKFSLDCVSPAFGDPVFRSASNSIEAAQNRLRINLDQPSEVRYWTTVLKVDEATLRALVGRVAPSADQICDYLDGE